MFIIDNAVARVNAPGGATPYTSLPFQDPRTGEWRNMAPAVNIVVADLVVC